MNKNDCIRMLTLLAKIRNKFFVSIDLLDVKNDSFSFLINRNTTLLDIFKTIRRMFKIHSQYLIHWRKISFQVAVILYVAHNLSGKYIYVSGKLKRVSFHGHFPLARVFKNLNAWRHVIQKIPCFVKTVAPGNYFRFHSWLIMHMTNKQAWNSFYEN